MGIDKGLSRLAGKQDFIRIAILLTIALVIGVYLIATTTLINKDAVLYIEQAQNFPDNPSLGLRGAYPPGYPFLIYIAHQIVSLTGNSESVETWIYSAQSVSLLSRMLSLIPLYFIGKLLVGSRNSCIALLILIFLPYPAKYGSEIVREWPHLLFLATAFFFLIRASSNGKWPMFAAAGLFAGIGYMIRPECAQIVLYAMLWLSVRLFIPNPNINRLKALCLTAILIVGFLIPTIAYSKMMGEIIPPKLKDAITANNNSHLQEFEKPAYTASLMPTAVLKAIKKLAERISENLIYFFTLPLILGLYYHFRKPKQVLADGRLFISASIILYVAMMMVLHINFGYISRRHFMPMIVLTVFYIPTGLLMIADWLSKINLKEKENKQKITQKWFFILLTIGILICFVKLFGHIDVKGKSYREAAKWLKQNTAPADIIDVPDARIAFYAQRRRVVNSAGDLAADINYSVRILKEQNDSKKNIPPEMLLAWSFPISNKGEVILIYEKK